MLRRRGTDETNPRARTMASSTGRASPALRGHRPWDRNLYPQIFLQVIEQSRARLRAEPQVTR